MSPLGALITQLRESAGLTRPELAERSGVDRGKLYRIEAGQIRKPTADTLNKLAGCLGLEPEVLHDAVWQEAEEPLPSFGVYFHRKYHLDDDQIAQLRDAVPDWWLVDGDQSGLPPDMPAQMAQSAREAEATLTPRGRRKRAALVEAARSVFEEKGYENCRITDITSRAKAAYGTFYTYFDSKEAIISEIYDELLLDFKAVYQAEPEGASTPAQLIERANRSFLRGYHRHARMMVLLEYMAIFNEKLRDIRLAAHRTHVGRTYRAICEWQREGFVDSDVDAYYAATALGAMVNRSAYYWIALGEQYDEDTAVEQLTLLYCRALGIPYDRS
jgi:AcrR family transcriptional regulator/transcriptional regulator with XRE-family HTH domain